MSRTVWSFRVGGSAGVPPAVRTPVLGGGSVPVQQSLPLSLPGGNRPVNRTVLAVLRQAAANGGNLG